MKPNECWSCPDTEPPGLALGCQLPGVRLKKIEEEKEGTGIASDVVKVQGENPGTQVL